MKLLQSTKLYSSTTSTTNCMFFSTPTNGQSTANSTKYQLDSNYSRIIIDIAHTLRYYKALNHTRTKTTPPSPPPPP